MSESPPPLRYFEDLVVPGSTTLAAEPISAQVVAQWRAWVRALVGAEPPGAVDEVPDRLLHSLAGGVIGRALGFTALLGIRHAHAEVVRALRVGEPFHFVLSSFEGEALDERLASLRYRIEAQTLDGATLSWVQHEVVLARRPPPPAP